MVFGREHQTWKTMNISIQNHWKIIKCSFGKKVIGTLCRCDEIFIELTSRSSKGQLINILASTLPIYRLNGIHKTIFHWFYWLIIDNWVPINQYIGFLTSKLLFYWTSYNHFLVMVFHMEHQTWIRMNIRIQNHWRKLKVFFWKKARVILCNRDKIFIELISWNSKGQLINVFASTLPIYWFNGIHKIIFHWFYWMIIDN